MQYLTRKEKKKRKEKKELGFNLDRELEIRFNQFGGRNR